MPSSTRPVVLVTGSAQRIGLAIARDLAQHGWDVAVHYRQSEAAAHAAVAALQQDGAQARAFAADLADEAQCEALLPAVRAAFGRVDAVVNNASAFELDTLDTFTSATLDRMWRANTAPAIVLARALHRALAPGQQGVVVNLLDQKLWNPNPDYLSYTLSKAALHTATTLLAQALAPRVRVCGVAPGLVLGSDLIDPARLAALQAATPLGQGVTAEQVAASVRFVLSCGAITGASLLVDAGSHLRPSERDFAFMPQS